VNQATGQTQWDMPQHSAPPQTQYSSPPPPTGGAYGGYQPPHAQGQYGQPNAPYGQAPPQGQYGSGPSQVDQSRGQANSFYDSYGGAMPSVPPQGQHDTRANQYYGDVEKKDKKKDEKKSSGYGGAIGGAAAGLAVGGIGGALIANALDDSDDEKPHAAAAAPSYAPAPTNYAPVPDPSYGGYGAPSQDSYGYNAPAPVAQPSGYGGSAYEPGLYDDAPLPDETRSGSSVSSSDRESLEEKREELREAQEEYEEEYAETYDD
jgi:hypothetical protein